MNDTVAKAFSRNGVYIVAVNTVILPQGVGGFCMFRMLASFPESSGCPVGSCGLMGAPFQPPESESGPGKLFLQAVHVMILLVQVRKPLP